MDQELKSKKKGVSGLAVFLLIILFLAAGLVGGWYVGHNNLLQIGKETTKKEEKETTKETKEVSAEAKQKMDDFIDAATFFSYSMSNTAEKFYAGITNENVTPDMKVAMTYVKLLEMDKKSEQASEIPQNVSEAVGGTANESATTVKISDYDEAYKSFFNEDPQYDTKNGGCPYPRVVDKTTGKIYLFSRCGGSGPQGIFISKNISYDFDGNNYYVNQAVVFQKEVNIPSVKINKIVWKFDKDLNFVSTTAE